MIFVNVICRSPPAVPSPILFSIFDPFLLNSERQVISYEMTAVATGAKILP